MYTAEPRTIVQDEDLDGLIAAVGRPQQSAYAVTP